MAAQIESEVKNAEPKKSEPETQMNEDVIKSKNETVSREGDASKSFDFPSYPKRVAIPPRPHYLEKDRTRSNTGSPMWERKVSSESTNGAHSLTPGKSWLRQVTLGDESPDDSIVVPVFGDWDDRNSSAEGYSDIFDKVREEKHGGGGKSPRITSNNSYFYGQRPKTKKGCNCFPWGRK